MNHTKKSIYVLLVAGIWVYINGFSVFSQEITHKSPAITEIQFNYTRLEIFNRWENKRYFLIGEYEETRDIPEKNIYPSVYYIYDRESKNIVFEHRPEELTNYIFYIDENNDYFYRLKKYTNERIVKKFSIETNKLVTEFLAEWSWSEPIRITPNGRYFYERYKHNEYYNKTTEYRFYDTSTGELSFYSDFVNGRSWRNLDIISYNRKDYVYVHTYNDHDEYDEYNNIIGIEIVDLNSSIGNLNKIVDLSDYGVYPDRIDDSSYHPFIKNDLIYLYKDDRNIIVIDIASEEMILKKSLPENCRFAFDLNYYIEENPDNNSLKIFDTFSDSLIYTYTKARDEYQRSCFDFSSNDIFLFNNCNSLTIVDMKNIKNSSIYDWEFN